MTHCHRSDPQYRSPSARRMTAGIFLAVLVTTLFLPFALQGQQLELLPRLSTPQQRLLPPSRTSVRIWDGRGERGKEHFQCLENVRISLPSTEKMRQWWILWSTGETGFSRAICQLSMFPFPETVDNWRSPPGLLHSEPIGTISGTGDQQLFAINLAALLPKGEKASPQQTVSPGSFSLSARNPRFTEKPKATLQLKQRPVLEQKPHLAMHLTSIRPRAFSFYVRIITLNSNGELAAQPSRPAVLHLSTPGPSNVTWYGDPSRDAYEHQEPHAPTVRIDGYEPFRPWQSDWSRHFIVTRDMPLLGYEKGERIFIPRDDGSKSGWEAVTDALGNLAGFVADSISRVGDAYNSLKQKALDLAISLAKNTVGCGSTCQQAFSFGLDYGLAAMGMPPSIPDFEAMMSMGKDYLVAEIASEVSPYLSEKEVSRAIDYFESEVRNTADHGKSGNEWLKLDPDFQYRDAILTLAVTNPTAKTTDRISCRISQFHEVFDFPMEPKDYYISIPPLKPGQSMQIPVMLRPNNIQCNNGKGMLMNEWNALMKKGVLLRVYPGSNEQIIVSQ
ncbi:hypothetical protein INT08_04435 [Prosthecochloris sp. N3]|uniref:Uncharacterized protein n=2 Tax=Prosthecochloris ethylica TaxID=2743976 RepID=A0ABR9XQV2_9CHLB|nr:hypothetical protein [Prosthecochloris ethylica]MBF0636426.1 hypothetical protein [Prosthecochloris ethylica]NUK47600.1 hypothetical protein [Prosthecochloris ethylica]